MKNERCGSASNFELCTLRMLPDIIREVDGYPVVFGGTTTDHRRGNNYFGGATWELAEEKHSSRNFEKSFGDTYPCSTAGASISGDFNNCSKHLHHAICA